MEFAVHMKNIKTNEERIKKVIADNVCKATSKDFFYNSEWKWQGTEPFRNVADNVEHIGKGYYKKKER